MLKWLLCRSIRCVDVYVIAGAMVLVVRTVVAAVVVTVVVTVVVLVVVRLWRRLLL